MIAAVTGANGFIGQHLVRRFSDAGWETRAVIRSDLESGARPLEQCLEGADVVVHAAGATRAPRIATLYDSNVRLTDRVVDAAKRVGVGRVVFISSQAAAGPAVSREAPTTETATPSPIEAYGRTKLDAERLLHSAAGLAFVVVRPAAVYGPGDRDFLAMFRLARWGIAVHPGNRNQWISIIHVDDLADGVMRASTDGRAVGQTYFMANDDPIQWGQLFRDCAASIGRSLTMDLQFPGAAVRAGALVGDAIARVTGRSSLLTSQKVALAAPEFWICSNERAARELGHSPAIGLSDGLRTTYQWYVANGWL